MKIIRDLWITTKGGVVVFDRTYEEGLNPQLFGGLMSAITMFSEQISDGGLSSFEYADRLFTVMQKGSFLFVASADKRFKKKKVQKELLRIIVKFFDTFSEEILEHRSFQVSLFEGFDKVIENSLEETQIKQ